MKNIKRLLVAISNEPESQKVAAEALQLAEQLNAQIALISVIERPLIMMNNDLMGLGMNVNENVAIEMDMEDAQKHGFEESHKLLSEKMFDKYNVTSFIEEGVPEDVILMIAEQWDADIIVLGTHGRTGFEHFLIGSVSEKVIRHAKRPVLVVPVK